MAGDRREPTLKPQEREALDRVFARRAAAITRAIYTVDGVRWVQMEFDFCGAIVITSTNRGELSLGDLERPI